MGEPLTPIGPAAERVRRQLLNQIDRGNLRPGERLGAERDLAQELGVSRSTVRQALAALESAGTVRRVPGRGGGTFVRSQKIERDLSKVVGVPALLRAQGMTSGSRIISTAIVLADHETATAMGLAQDLHVIDVVRIRLADGSPISLEHVCLPAERFPRLLDLPLGGSLYDLLKEHYDTGPGEAEEHIEVKTADEDEASLLGTEPGAPLLSITRTTKDTAGAVFEYSHDLFRADRTVITVRTPASKSSGNDSVRVVPLRARLKR